MDQAACATRVSMAQPSAIGSRCPRRFALVVCRALFAQAPNRHARAARASARCSRSAMERPVAWRVEGTDPVAGHVAHAIAAQKAASRVPARGKRGPRSSRLAAEVKAVFHTATALADRLRPNRHRATAAPSWRRSSTARLPGGPRTMRPTWARCCGSCADDVGDDDYTWWALDRGRTSRCGAGSIGRGSSPTLARAPCH